MRRRLFVPIVVTGLVMLVSYCTHTQPKEAPPPAKPVLPPAAPEPVAVPTPTPPPAAPISAGEASTPAVPPPPVSEQCQPTPGFPNDEPIFLPSASVVLTRIASPCTTPDGKHGHLPTGGWMAMGFPCSGGEGRIDWKGTNYNVPKMVSFLLDTSCPMAPADPHKLKEMVIRETGIPATAPLVAFNPFVVQYWEIPGYDDADASFTVDLRNNKSLTGAWSQFIKQKPIKVFLVGRENAWVPGNHMYAVDAEMHWVSKNRFTMKVLGAHLLKGDELTAVKARCEALKPERECGKVF